MPKISVVIPSYNVEKFVVKCLNSIKQQTFTDFEVFIIDDSFLDNTRILIKELIKSDSRFNLIELDDNEIYSVGEKRNIGIEHSSGEFMIFIDSDDYCEVDMFEKAYFHAIKHDLDIGVFNYRKVDENGQIIQISDIGYSDVIFEYDSDNFIENYVKYWLAVFPMYYSWNKIFKLEVIKSNDITFAENVYIAEDMLFNSLVLTKSKKVSYISDVLYNYVKHRESITNKHGNVELIAPGFYCIYDTLIKAFENEGFKNHELIKGMLLISFMGHAMSHVRRNVGNDFELLEKYFDDVLKDIDIEADLGKVKVAKSVEYFVKVKNGQNVHSAQSYIEFFDSLMTRDGAIARRQRLLNNT